jgi:hypothetical protein
MAQDGDVVPSGHTVFARVEEAAEGRLHAEERKEVGGDGGEAELSRGAMVGDEEQAAGPAGGEVAHGGDPVADLYVVGVGDPFRRGVTRPPRGDDDEAPWMFGGDRTPHHRVVERENRGDRADGQGQDEQRGQGEARTP